MIKTIKENSLAILFFFIAAALIIWQLFLPGYVLTLDMVFTPKIKIFLASGEFYNSLPFKYLLAAVNYLLPGWVIQKIVFLSLFFSIGYLAYYYLPLPKKNFAPYWAGLFFLANPFVYERFLAGNWLLLFGYAGLPFFIYYLLKFFQQPNWPNSLGLVFSLLLIGLFSLHLFTMAIILFFGLTIYKLIKAGVAKKIDLVKKIFVKLLIVGILTFLFSSYWLVPYFLNAQQSVINNFNQEQWTVFKTATNSSLGTTLNVLSLYGYWGENQPWANYFLWPRANFIPWLIIAILLFCLVVIGFCQGRKSKNREVTVIFLVVGLMGFIFSCGLSDTIFKSLNLWLFKHIWFWQGFRDSQKWTAFLVLSYVFFGALGVDAILDFAKRKIKPAVKIILIILFTIPVLYTYTIWGGFGRQLQPVWYPNSWSEVNKILNQDRAGDYQVLFLPWHQYLSFKFNQYLIIQNPAKDYFDQPIIQGENMELGGVWGQGQNLLVQKIEDILRQSSDESQPETLRKLALEGVKYIIVSHDLEGMKQAINFIPVESAELRQVFDAEDLTLYQIMLR
ncbi:MAG: hypothetical protein WC508_00570 [Patescibacteria group bacterium]